MTVLPRLGWSSPDLEQRERQAEAIDEQAGAECRQRDAQNGQFEDADGRVGQPADEYAGDDCRDEPEAADHDGEYHGTQRDEQDRLSPCSGRTALTMCARPRIARMLPSSSGKPPGPRRVTVPTSSRRDRTAAVNPTPAKTMPARIFFRSQCPVIGAEVRRYRSIFTCASWATAVQRA